MLSVLPSTSVSTLHPFASPNPWALRTSLSLAEGRSRCSAPSNTLSKVEALGIVKGSVKEPGP